VPVHRAHDFFSCLCTHEKDVAADACRNYIPPRCVAQTPNRLAKACLSPAPHQQMPQNDIHHVRHVPFLRRLLIQLFQTAAKSLANEDAGAVGMVGPAARNASAFHVCRPYHSLKHASEYAVADCSSLAALKELRENKNGHKRQDDANSSALDTVAASTIVFVDPGLCASTRCLRALEYCGVVAPRVEAAFDGDADESHADESTS
jgi:hypothetical protein